MFLTGQLDPWRIPVPGSIKMNCSEFEIFFTGQLDPGGDSGARLIHMKSSKVQSPESSIIKLSSVIKG